MPGYLMPSSGACVKYASLLGLLLVMIALPDAAHAGGAIRGVICDVVWIVTGDIGKPIATASILAIACMALFGRVGWGVVMVTVTGIAIIFSASQVVGAITGGGC